MTKKLFVNANTRRDLAIHIIEKAKAFGSSLAGLTDIVSLLDSPSYRNARLFTDDKSVLIIALAHPRTEPSLDWWDGKEGGSPGNRRLISIATRLAEWLKGELDIKAQLLPYHVGKGGIFLKDAAVLAGLGVVGANNLLITPEYGPRIRLRALLFDAKLGPTGPMDSSPCDSCNIRCREACPQKAFTQGSYNRDLCMRQMKMDEGSPNVCVRYCRACELACPVGQKSENSPT